MKHILLTTLAATVLVLTGCGSSSTTQTAGVKSGSQPQGGQTGNGHFLFGESSIPLLDRAQENLINELKAAPAGLIAASFDQEKPVDIQKLTLIIHAMKKDKYTGESVKELNEDTGNIEPRDFAIENGQLVAQPLFFESNTNVESGDPIPLQKTMNSMLHESLHEFGYGDKAAKYYSARLLRNIGANRDCYIWEDLQRGFECVQTTDDNRSTMELGILSKMTDLDQPDMLIFASDWGTNKVASVAKKPLLSITTINGSRLVEANINSERYLLSDFSCTSTEIKVVCQGSQLIRNGSMGLRAKDSSVIVTVELREAWDNGKAIPMSGAFTVKVVDTRTENLLADIKMPDQDGRFRVLVKQPRQQLAE